MAAAARTAEAAVQARGSRVPRPVRTRAQGQDGSEPRLSLDCHTRLSRVRLLQNYCSVASCVGKELLFPKNQKS